MDVMFSFSDLISGYVERFDWSSRSFSLRTSDGRVFDAKLTDNTGAELLRNLGEPYVDCTGQMADMLAPGRFVFAYGVHYPEPGKPFEAKHLVFVGRTQTGYRFESQDWWIRQISQLADFYLKSQFPDNLIDYRNYRTELTMYGTKTDDFRQETDTISRLVYGFASALPAHRRGSLPRGGRSGHRVPARAHALLRPRRRIVYWYHGIDVQGERESQDPRLGVRRRLRRHPGLRADLRPGRAHPDLPDHRRPARSCSDAEQDRRRCSTASSATSAAAAISRHLDPITSTRAPNRWAPTAPARTGTRSATTLPPI